MTKSLRAVALFAIAVAVPACLLPAQQIRITNSASYPRKQWVDVAVPASDAAPLASLCRLDPHGWIAVKGSAIGQHSRLFHVLATLGPGASVTGNLVSVSNDPAQIPARTQSQWVTQAPFGMTPVPVVMDSSGVERRATNLTVSTVEDVCQARRVTRYRGRLAGTPLVFDGIVYVYHQQDVVKVELTFTNSDERYAGMSWDLGGMWIESGEYLAVDWRTRLGLPAPFQQVSSASHPSFLRWVTLLSGPRTMGRNEQIHFTGSYLCLPHGPPMTNTVVTAGPMSTTITEFDRIGNLIATFLGPVNAIHTGWQGKWLGFGILPELPHGTTAGGWNAANQSANAFRAMLQYPGDMYVQRPRGLNRNAATTGAQEDFGAAKGSLAAKVGDPRFIDEMAYSVHGELFLRPFHYREIDGSPFKQANHPSYQTWSQYVNCRTTGTTLGVACPLPYSWPYNGWTSYDDQHRSQNNFHALLALTGDWSLRDTLDDLLQIDLTQVPNWMDSPRAEGRLFMAWASMLLLLDSANDRTLLQNHMGRRIATIQNLWLGRNFVNNPQRPIRAMSIGTDPTFLDPQGVRIPAIIVWEHSIAAMGFYAAWRVTGDTRHRDMAREISKLIVNHCMFQQNGTWHACTAVRYLQGAQEGQALPASSYYLGSPDIHLPLDFWTWIAPAVLICRDVNSADTALVARCNAILQNRAPNGPTNWDQAEWWAVLPR